ncbi:Carboxypeptidase Y inhibitor [Pseudocercospora fuligena]|uniref:Carboxypeptidase Y inhibitor n=1 Tax=Pseudocercospora fuligena TaxID=685502 RepID=A0A8H6R986_9PEZI|nr:Carboxypeptidase Y inhibitor [Pseudocercospora fuligena]
MAPFLTISAEWQKSKKFAKIGNTIKPKKLQEVPEIQLRDHLPDLSAWNDTTGVPQLTLALTDPDAKSRDDPKWSQMLHWLITDVNLTHTQSSSSSNYTEIYSYKPPGPPPKTGKHRYVFVALAPKNGTTEKLFLTKPKERQHWGYGKVRAGVREWAEENGLETVGANFFYAKDKKQ